VKEDLIEVLRHERLPRRPRSKTSAAQHMPKPFVQ